jgi:hypothetical protein
MSQFEIRIKGTALENLRSSRAKILERLGSSRIADSLVGLDADQAGALANELLELLDNVDRVITRAKPVG